MGKNNTKNKLYVGVDVGGTKIQASLVEESGTIRTSKRCPTPREANPEQILETIETAITEVLQSEQLGPDCLTGIGIAIPGVVDPKKGVVVATPNINFSGAKVVKYLQPRFSAKVVLGNDCNLGTLGEAWLGSARKASSVVGILVGTGIGSGFVQKGKLWRGFRESAMEIGHMVMQVGGPVCGCGNQGCFEALASRTAIERDIRARVEKGEQTVLTDILEGDLSLMRSSSLRAALEQEDKVVTEVMRHAAEILGHACMSIRHLFDPEVIVLGGGVMEACSNFILPIVEEIVASDKLPGARQGGRVLLSSLGDDAVVLGAVALARSGVGRNPFKKSYFVEQVQPQITQTSFGEITVDKETYQHDIYLMVNGKVAKRKKRLAKDNHGNSHLIGAKELSKVCKGGPEILFVGTGQSNEVELAEEGKEFLDQRVIEYQLIPTPEIAKVYNSCTKRKAALIHVTC